MTTFVGIHSLEWSNTCQVETAVYDELEDGANFIFLASMFLGR